MFSLSVEGPGIWAADDVVRIMQLGGEHTRGRDTGSGRAVSHQGPRLVACGDEDEERHCTRQAMNVMHGDMSEVLHNLVEAIIDLCRYP